MKTFEYKGESYQVIDKDEESCVGCDMLIECNSDNPPDNTIVPECLIEPKIFVKLERMEE